ncbi:MBL fold metallo-hydrolase [Temperatibacter marinus]|uniref:MBL fold metallo-hydrolase n=1 Tax=Temperatibacter marinus TaxID=1456591 RepID=A0AA52EHE4_9PROT|nr:MBL fold metallo-hydrolase [Temperatibacter marinus]WND02111.1 MBL fold metallo-hydrolase [Temperatibacter marinus]
MQDIKIEIFFDPMTYTASYIVYDNKTRDAVIIDSVLNLDLTSGSITTDSADELRSYVHKNKLKIHYILETHVHADHLSAAAYLKHHYHAKTGIGAAIVDVQSIFGKLYNIKDIKGDGSDFDVLLKDNDCLKAGSMDIRCLATPGHTPACMTYVIQGNAFVGDTLFMPDFGSARCDFPGGCAETLYESIQKILTLGNKVNIYVGHDYAPNGREYEFVASIADHLENNIHINQCISREKFIKMRTERDSELSPPRLLLPSLQVNIKAGQLPTPEENETRYLKIPLIVKEIDK